MLSGYSRVVTECHPALVDESAVRFRDQIEGKLEIAIGLETAHPSTLEKLNKRMTLEMFTRAADFLRGHGIDLRVFLLVQPPFMPDATQALEWTARSVEFAFDCGATVVSMIPTRAGNGALETLARDGLFVPPKMATLERALAQGLTVSRGRGRGRVFADVWDLETFSNCAACFEARRERLTRMNLHQRMEPEVLCGVCNGSGPHA
jgi:radical SAM enzyme (TIGR01210 family)